jgi:hypothetical protein
VVVSGLAVQQWALLRVPWPAAVGHARTKPQSSNTTSRSGTTPIVAIKKSENPLLLQGTELGYEWN